MDDSSNGAAWAGGRDLVGKAGKQVASDNGERREC